MWRTCCWHLRSTRRWASVVRLAVEASREGGEQLAMRVAEDAKEGARQAALMHTTAVQASLRLETTGATAMARRLSDRRDQSRRDEPSQGGGPGQRQQCQKVCHSCRAARESLAGLRTTWRRSQARAVGRMIRRAACLQRVARYEGATSVSDTMAKLKKRPAWGTGEVLLQTEPVERASLCSVWNPYDPTSPSCSPSLLPLCRCCSNLEAGWANTTRVRDPGRESVTTVYALSGNAEQGGPR